MFDHSVGFAASLILMWSGRLLGTVPLVLAHIARVQQPPRRCHCYKLLSYQRCSISDNVCLFVVAKMSNMISWHLVGFVPTIVVKIPNTTYRITWYIAKTNKLEAASSAIKCLWAKNDSWVSDLFVLPAGGIVRRGCPKQKQQLVLFNPLPQKP